MDVCRSNIKGKQLILHPLLALLRGRIREKKSQEQIQCIRDKKWIQPLLEGKPMTESIEKRDDGKENGLALIITDSPVHLSHYDGEYRFTDISLEKAVEMTKGFTIYQEVWLLLEFQSNGRTQSVRFVLKASNLEEVLGVANS